jgi:tetraacyldisaccharide 4'-kinase
MNPVSKLYGAGVALRNSFYDRGVLRSHELDVPVVSVGNIRVGGAGKTPFTIKLGGLLKERGIAFDVLSRGYKRQTTGVQVVNANGEASDFGDEPLLIAKRLQVPVIVAGKRYDAGRLGEARFQSQMHLLDDGFQHRQLARQFDIVLVDEADLADSLLPSGRLREPVAALQRADVLVIPADQKRETFSQFGKPLWRVRRELEFVGPVPRRPVVFCGLAKPERFVADLRERGVDPVCVVMFPDHHRYTRKDTEQLRWAMERNGADGFITTQKDLMNLGGLVHQLVAISIPILNVELDESDLCIDFLLQTIASRQKHRS